MYLEREFSSIEHKFLELCSVATENSKLEIYDLEYLSQNKTLKLFIIDLNTNSATITDCCTIDRALSEPFEELDWIPEDIILEVSSPGIYRNLYTKNHFENSIDQQIKVELVKKIGSIDLYDGVPKKLVNQKRFLAFIKSFSENSLELEYEESILTVPFEEIKKVSLEN